MAEYREFPVSDENASFAECIWTSIGLEQTKTEVIPDGCIDVVLNYLDHGRVHFKLVGAMTSTKSVAVSKGQQFVGIRFRPGMASSFVQGNLSTLTDQTAPAQAWIGKFTERIVRNIVGCGDIQERLSLIQTLLKMPREPSLVQIAITKLASTYGKTTIEEMCDISHLGERQFRRSCLLVSGLSPKQLSSILRFRRAYQLIDEGPSCCLADVAIEAGYFDQSHFCREFRRYAGIAPSTAVQIFAEGRN
jgi:AraC-like DNA-binding protein